MTFSDDAFVRHEQMRWLKHDAARWVRPDAARFLKPGTKIDDVFPALALKYNSGQPRVPAGSGRESGRWTDRGGGDDGELTAEDVVAARRSNELECEFQYRRDTFICNSVGLMSCWRQAAERYGACLAGRPIPPLNF